MARFKKEIKSDFTVIHNAFVRDMNLGINARGILITMLSLPELQFNGEPWNFTIRGLASILPDGKTKVQSALNELEKHGYLLRRQIIENGRFVDTEYIFSDEPIYRIGGYAFYQLRADQFEMSDTATQIGKMAFAKSNIGSFTMSAQLKNMKVICSLMQVSVK